MSLTTPRFDARARRLFLQTLQATGNLSAAARAAGISTSTVAGHRAADPDFDAQVVEAIEDYCNDFEGALAHRAMYGVKKYLWSNGKPCLWPEDHEDPEKRGKHAYDMVYSDSLGPVLLKAQRPERHRDRSDVKLVSRSEQLDDESLIAKARKVLEDVEMRRSGEQPDGVRLIEAREIRPEDLL